MPLIGLLLELTIKTELVSIFTATMLVKTYLHVYSKVSKAEET